MGGRTNQATHKCLGQNSKSFYLWVDERTKSFISTLVKKIQVLRTGGRMNQATQECLGQNSKSSYLREDGRTKSPKSALVKI